MSKFVSYVYPAVILIAIFVSFSSAAIVLDDFSGEWDIDPETLGVIEERIDTDLTGVYGGSRQVDYFVEGSSLSGAGLEMCDGIFALNSGRKNWSGVTLTYDSNGQGLDLDLSEAQSLSVDISFEHVGVSRPTKMIVSLNDGMEIAVSEKIWDSEEDDVVGTISFMFSEFENNDTVIDMESIYLISIYIESDMGGDYEFGSDDSTGVELNGVTVNMIPEPATIALLAIGGLLLRKRQ